METPNVELMQMARQSLAGKWGLAIGTLFARCLFFYLLCVIPILGQLGALLLAGPYMLGLATFHWTLPGMKMPNLSRFSKASTISQRHWVCTFASDHRIFIYTIVDCSPALCGQFLTRWVITYWQTTPVWRPWKCSTKASTWWKDIKWNISVWCCGFWSIAVVHPYTGNWLFVAGPIHTSDPCKIYEDLKKDSRRRVDLILTRAKEQHLCIQDFIIIDIGR